MSAGLPLVTLLTDFGSSDTYVGQMKGAILSACRHAQLVDLTHAIAPGDIAAGALAWGDAVSAFPPGTIHLAVVDPGVGSGRRAIAAEIGDWKFVCPDNGLITRVLQKWPLRRAVQLQNREFWRPTVSPVFHGRDVFGPVAGHWAAGHDLSEFGPLIDESLLEIAIQGPRWKDGILFGEIIAVDQFGNLRTNIPAEMLTGPPEDWIIEVSTATIPRLSCFFGEQLSGTLMALIGSHGCVEIAVNRGSAADLYHLQRGAEVRIRSSTSDETVQADS